MDRQIPYPAIPIPIPPRQTESAGKVLPSLKPDSVVSLTDTPFAEIEVEAGPVASVAGADSRLLGARPAPQSQPIKQAVIGSLREQISQITSSSSGSTSSGYPYSRFSYTRNPYSGYSFYSRNDPESFYRKAKQLESKTSDYEGNAPFFMYYPSYQFMGNEQLKTYLTWRTRVRGGDIQQTSLSYVYLYVYELLACVGVANPADALDQLLYLWTNYRAYDSSLDRYVLRWIKDFHVYYQLPLSFAGFVKEHGLHGRYPASFLFCEELDNRFELWNELSGYDVTKSRFYNDGNQKLYQQCLVAVLDGISKLCLRNGRSIESLFSFSTDSLFNWHPFSGALFYDWMSQPDRTVELPGGEIYSCKNNLWKSNTYAYMANRKDIIGYVLKKIEVCLRQHFKYRYQLSVKRGYFVYDLMRAELSFEELDQTIEQSVADFLAERSRVVVTIDPGILARIRDDALGTQKRLTVPEEGVSLVSPAAPVLVAPAPATPSPASALTPPSPAPPSPAFNTTDCDQEEWTAFSDALSPTEHQALSLILQNSPTGAIKTFADANNVMLEILLNGINEKALDFVGDTILKTDDNIEVYPEYAARIAKLMSQLAPVLAGGAPLVPRPGA